MEILRRVREQVQRWWSHALFAKSWVPTAIGITAVVAVLLIMGILLNSIEENEVWMFLVFIGLPFIILDCIDTEQILRSPAARRMAWTLALGLIALSMGTIFLMPHYVALDKVSYNIVKCKKEDLTLPEEERKLTIITDNGMKAGQGTGEILSNDISFLFLKTSGDVTEITNRCPELEGQYVESYVSGSFSIGATETPRLRNVLSLEIVERDPSDTRREI